MAHLQAIKNHLIVQFVDAVIKKAESIGSGDQGHHEFVESTDWGFQFTRRDDTAQHPRWAIVQSAGKDATEFKPGMKVLVEALRWTEGFEFQDEKYWRTDADQILAVDDDVVPA